tara:strand:+ start:1189 stop:1335 length:147 start_codon:yes stop_codon:yes gene_type:complete
MIKKTKFPHDVRLRIGDEMKKHLERKKETLNYCPSDYIRDLISKDMRR